jgi:hypothetical protein
MLNFNHEPIAPNERPDAVSWCLKFADVWSERDRITDIDVRSLLPGTTLIVDTRNSSYRVATRGEWGGNVLVQGGSFFREETKARVAGSTARGSAIKIGWICVGLRMEISVGRRRFVTSPVQSIRVESFQPRLGLDWSHDGYGNDESCGAERKRSHCD